MRPRIDEELDNRKRVYAGIDTVLVSTYPPLLPREYWLTHTHLSVFLQSKVAVQISYKVPLDYARALNVVYFPQLGQAYFRSLILYNPFLTLLITRLFGNRLPGLFAHER